MSQFLNYINSKIFSSDSILITDSNKNIIASTIPASQLSKLNLILDSGDGNSFLANDGTYKAVDAESATYINDFYNIENYATFDPSLAIKENVNIRGIINANAINYGAANSSSGLLFGKKDSASYAMITLQSGQITNGFMTRSYYNGVWGSWQRIAMQDWVTSSITSSIHNDLTSTLTTKSLSANQGRVLNETKISKTGDSASGTITWTNQPTNGIINSNIGTSWLNAHKGIGVPIFLSGTANSYKPFVRGKSTNGAFAMGIYNNYLNISYMPQTNIDNEFNAVTALWRFNEDSTAHINTTYPQLSNTYDLGSSVLKWRNIYANELYGNAQSATKLQTARTINGVAFDGTQNITIAASGGETYFEDQGGFITAKDNNNVAVKGIYPINSSSEESRSYAFLDSNNNTTASLNYKKLAGSINEVGINLKKPNDSTWVGIQLGSDSVGNVYTKAPKPNKTDTSTAIATTNWTREQNYVASSDQSVKFTQTLTEIEFTILKNNNQLVPNTVYNITDEVVGEQVHAETTIPIGATVLYYGSQSSIPSAYLECLGQSLSTSEYPELFSALGYTFGGSGSNFNLPNMASGGVGRTPVQVAGIRNTGDIWGSETHTLTEAELASHKHNSMYGSNVSKSPLVDIGVSDTSFGLTFNTDGGYKAKPGYMESRGGNQPHNNMQPSIATRFIIKVKEDVSTTNLRNLDSEVVLLQNKVDEYKALVDTYFSSMYAGEYILWQGDVAHTNNSAWYELGYNYYFINQFDEKFPQKTGFTRVYKLQLDYTDNITNGTGTYIKLINNTTPTDYVEKIFGSTYGGTTNFYRRMDTLSFSQAEFDKLGTGHLRMEFTPAFAATGAGTTAQSRIYKLAFHIYYERSI